MSDRFSNLDFDVPELPKRKPKPEGMSLMEAMNGAPISGLIQQGSTPSYTMQSTTQRFITLQDLQVIGLK